MSIVISPKIRDKLATKHNVSQEDVEQCFANRNGNYIEDTRAQHVKELPTYWFIAETHYGRRLKVAFINENGNVYVRTAFEPSEATIRNYVENGGGVI